MKKFVKSLDIFPLQFQFNLKEGQLIKTIWGGIFSLCFCFVAISLITFNAYTYFKNQIPVVLATQQFIANKPSEKFPLDKLNFVAIFLEEGTLKQLLTPIYQSTAIYNDIDLKNNSFIKSKIGEFNYCSDSTNPVSIDLIKKLEEKVFISPNLSYCYNNLPEIKEINLGGSIFETQESKEIYMYFVSDLCKNLELANFCNITSVLNQIDYVFSIYFNNFVSSMTQSMGYQEFLDTESVIVNLGRDVRVQILVKECGLFE
jgi:hypothetical protein